MHVDERNYHFGKFHLVQDLLFGRDVEYEFYLSILVLLPSVTKPCKLSLLNKCLLSFV